MIEVMNFLSGMLAGFGVALIVYVLVSKGEIISFWPRLALAVMAAGVMLNVPKQLLGWVDTPGGDWTYVVGRVGFVMFLWFAIWPHLRKTGLFAR